MNLCKISALLQLLLGLFLLQACSPSKPAGPQATASDTPTIAAKTAKMQLQDGFIPFYYEEKTDKIFLRIDSLNQEIIYVNSLAAGIGSNDIGLDRGQLGNTRIVKFERRGPKVLLIQPNYGFRALSENAAERQSVEQAFAQSVLWAFPIVAEEGGKLLLDASDFFMQDAHEVAETLKKGKQGTYSLEKSRNAFYMPRTKNFPKNSEFEVTLTFTGTPEGAHIRSVTPTPSVVSVRQHHSFVQLPDAGYTPREFDPRAGYFGISYYDYATPIDQPLQKRYIARHRLQKKDPSAATSEAVEPIVYYLDPGAPEPVRTALLEGGRWWNGAFEAAGYKNAFRVEMLPEEADPLDVRYNVIQWVHRSTRGWSYGASVMDPRTGEIIKGHVSLGSLRVRQDYLIAEALLSPYANGNQAPAEVQELALARLRQLSAHEIGHTLGLAHNYAASTEELASVMDYPHPRVVLRNGQIDISQPYDDKIAAWDKVAITWGYQDFPEGVKEKEALNALITDALGKGLYFLSDQDARPTGGAHPYAHLWDNSRDAADELTRMMEVRKVALQNLGVNSLREGTPMAQLEEKLVPVYFFHRYQTEAAVKLLGGLNYRYALKGDGQPVTEKVPAAQQWKAMDALLATIRPESLAFPETLLALIPPQPYGYSRSREVIGIRTGLTFDALAAAEAAANQTVSLLLDPARLNRLVEYHAQDPAQPSLQAVLDRLIGQTLKAPAQRGYAGELQRTVNYVVLHHLISMSQNKAASPQTQAMLKLKLSQLKPWLATAGRSGEESWQAHWAYAAELIKHLETEGKPMEMPGLLSPPPGAPIGSCSE
jgi:hypothetical protein